jgi:hypothetical protein
MPFTLDRVVPWGRSYDEYVAMFALADEDPEKRILGCGDGPAAFNSGVTKRGGRVVSVDPVYRYSAEDLRRRIDETYDRVMEETRKSRDDFVWRHIRSPEELGRKRMAAMEEFLADYPAGRSGGRYVEGGLPDLPFREKSFDLALCSHYLFLYSHLLSLDFHLRSIEELSRVAREVRIFPLLEFGSRKSPHLEGVLAGLREAGFEAGIETVPYEFQRGGNEMLRVVSASQRIGCETGN